MKYVDEQVERIRDVLWEIPLDSSIKLLTGKNGSGKSLIRNQLINRVSKECSGKLIHTSQELRTTSNPSLGALSGIFHDNPLLPTSLTTIYHIENACNTAKDGDNMLVIDEPEIGCGEETVLALCKWLNEDIFKNKIKAGILIITHNRYLIKNLKYNHFYNLDGYKTKKEWIERKIKPTNLKKLKLNRLKKALI